MVGPLGLTRFVFVLRFTDCLADSLLHRVAAIISCCRIYSSFGAPDNPPLSPLTSVCLFACLALHPAGESVVPLIGSSPHSAGGVPPRAAAGRDNAGRRVGAGGGQRFGGGSAGGPLVSGIGPSC